MEHESVKAQVEKLSPKTGDLLVFRVDPSAYAGPGMSPDEMASIWVRMIENTLTTLADAGVICAAVIAPIDEIRPIEVIAANPDTIIHPRVISLSAEKVFFACASPSSAGGEMSAWETVDEAMAERNRLREMGVDAWVRVTRRETVRETP